MKIAAFDLALKTGWCIGDTANGGDDLNEKNHGVFDCAKHATDAGHRFFNFHVWFRRLIKEESPRVVYFEEVNFHTSLQNGRIYGGLLSQVQLICHAEKILLRGKAVGTIKKHATGNGSAKKPEMIEAARRYGLSPIDDNDADAICLWYCAKEDF